VLSLPVALPLALALSLTVPPATTKPHRASMALPLTLLTTAAAPPAAGASPPVIRLPNRELRQRPGRRLLTFGTWQGCANQGASDRSLVSRRTVALRREFRFSDNLRCSQGCAVALCLPVSGREILARRVSVGRDRNNMRRKHGERWSGRREVRECWEFDFDVGLGEAGGLGTLQAFEHLRKQGGLRLLAPLHGDLPVLVLVLCVADAAASLFDVVVNHRHDGVISNTALARTVVVHHVAGPEPALLHALPRKPKSDHCAGGENGH
jgi:hypothetical protein